MEEWNDIESEATRRRIDDQISGSVSFESFSRRIKGATQKEIDEQERRFQEYVASIVAKTLQSTPKPEASGVPAISFEQPPKIESGGWTSSSGGGIPVHPVGDDNFDVEIGFEDGAEVLPGGTGELTPQAEEILPSGLKDGQLLIWNDGAAEWEPDELQLEITGNTLKIKSKGRGYTLAELDVEECE
jgi:hypothetical protein